MATQPPGQPASEEEGAGYASPAADLIAATGLIAIALWYTITALGFRAPGGWHTAPGLVPIAAGTSLAAMAIGLGVSAWRRRGEHLANIGTSEDDGDPRKIAAIVGIALSYGLALQFLRMPLNTTIAGRFVEFGVFEVATLLSLAALMRIFWNGAFWIIASIAVGWTALLAVTFRTIFYVSLPA